MLKYWKISDLINRNKSSEFVIDASIDINDETKEQLEMLMYEFGLKHYVVQNDENGIIQVAFVQKCGTNGKEGSIKNSLLDLYYLLNRLEQNQHINWTTVLDASIDNADDVYYFTVTFTYE